MIGPVLALTSDPIISEDMGLLVTRGKVLDYCSFQYSQLARAGGWEQSWELEQLRERRLSAVILEKGTRLDVDRYQRFTREFLSELDRNYRHARTLGNLLHTRLPEPVQYEKLRCSCDDTQALSQLRVRFIDRTREAVHQFPNRFQIPSLHDSHHDRFGLFGQPKGENLLNLMSS